MNCKNCGFPLNGNQTCPSCGTVNEIINEQTSQVNTSSEPIFFDQGTQSVQTLIPEATPIESTPTVSYEPPKKKNAVLIIILIVVGILVIGGGIFVGIKFFGPKPDPTPVEETQKNEETKTEKTDEEKDAKYASKQIFIDTMTEDELFNLVHDTLDYTITDGQTLEEFYNTLAISKTGKKISRISGGNGVDFEFLGVMRADTKRDYISKVHVACNYDFKNSLLFNSQSDSYSRSGMVELKIYSGKEEEIYNSIKTHYSNLYPGTEVKDSKGSGGVYNGTWIQFDLKTPDNNSITVRLEEERSKDRYAILIYETVLK